MVGSLRVSGAAGARILFVLLATALLKLLKEDDKRWFTIFDLLRDLPRLAVVLKKERL